MIALTQQILDSNYMDNIINKININNNNNNNNNSNSNNVDDQLPNNSNHNNNINSNSNNNEISINSNISNSSQSTTEVWMQIQSQIIDLYHNLNFRVNQNKARFHNYQSYAEQKLSKVEQNLQNCENVINKNRSMLRTAVQLKNQVSNQQGKAENYCQKEVLINKREQQKQIIEVFNNLFTTQILPMYPHHNRSFNSTHSPRLHDCHSLTQTLNQYSTLHSQSLINLQAQVSLQIATLSSQIQAMLKYREQRRQILMNKIDGLVEEISKAIESEAKEKDQSVRGMVQIMERINGWDQGHVHNIVMWEQNQRWKQRQSDSQHQRQGDANIDIKSNIKTDINKQQKQTQKSEQIQLIQPQPQQQSQSQSR